MIFIDSHLDNTIAFSQKKKEIKNNLEFRKWYLF